MKKYLVFVSVGFELIALILVAIYLGPKLEEKLGWSSGLGMAALIVLFLVLWFIRIIVYLKKIEKEEEKSESKSESSNE